MAHVVPPTALPLPLTGPSVGTQRPVFAAPLVVDAEPVASASFLTPVDDFAVTGQLGLQQTPSVRRLDRSVLSAAVGTEIPISQLLSEVASPIEATPEYRLVSEFYGDKRARRSGIVYMRLIHQGMRILDQLGAGESAKRAFSLAPLFLKDEDYRNNIHLPGLRDIDPHVLMLAVDYRNVISDYSSRTSIRELSDIRLSPHPEVNAMIAAQKIYNLKAFILAHRDQHERSVQLDIYFHTWMQRLGVAPEFVEATLRLLLMEDTAGQPALRAEVLKKIHVEFRPAVQAYLVRDGKNGLEVYMQKRSSQGVTLNRGQWAPMGGGMEPGHSAFKTLVCEAEEEGHVDVSGREAFFLGTGFGYSESKRMPGRQRYTLYLKFFLDGNGLEPHVNSPNESQGDGWFTIAEALALQDLSPGTRRALEEVHQMMQGGLTNVSGLLGTLRGRN